MDGMSTRRKQSRPSRLDDDISDDAAEGQRTLKKKKHKKNHKMSSTTDQEKLPPLPVARVKKVDDEDGMMSSDDEEIMSAGEPFETEAPLNFEEDEEQNGLEHISNGSPLKFRSREGSVEKDSDESPEYEKESLSAALQNLMVDFHWPEGTSITIERVESTKVAVAELTAAAIQSSAPEYSSASLQDLALIQSTLFTLQQQQIVQLQLIQQLLAQLAMCTEVDPMQEIDPNSPDESDGVLRNNKGSNKNNSSLNQNEEEKRGKGPSSGPTPKRPNTAPEGAPTSNNNHTNNQNGGTEKSGGSDALSLKFASILNCGNQDPNRPLSPGLSSHSFNLNSIMMPGDDGFGGEGVNTLEMLQKRAQEVLDSASQGLLSSSMVDENYKKSGGVMDKREPFFKHRCRYCGKVFGSDSALQIHIRSHTGERPFKCNVCGSRFTTKGNLKVHFQRHSAKFPHVKMNPHPVPEHLDHFHPPILSNGERSPDLLPTNMPFGPIPPFQPVNFMRFDEHAAKLRLGIQNLQDSLEPEDLSKAGKKVRLPGEKSSVPSRRRSPSRSDGEEEDEEPGSSKVRSGSKEDRKGRDGGKRETKDSEIEDDKDEDGDLEDIANDGDDGHPGDIDMDTEDSNAGLDQPENLSSKSLPLMHSLPLQVSRPGRPSSTSKMLQRPPGRDSSSPTPKEPERSLSSSGPLDDLSLMELTKDPRAYAALLPRPGSASSAWESLIEVNTSSETSKLQQLVDNIDNQISDPNECVVCHRVLSCKSALQMHYRTHTGERPFKCRLCGRAFTTKGNLKTHMGVHRIKEGDTHHQCPVCHKRFTTQLVLQQHIRLHTGEPTDLTLDQIRAGEIRDFIPNFNPNAPGALPFLQQQHQQQQQLLKSESSRDSTTTPGTPGAGAEVKFSTSLAALENQVRTVTTFAGTQGIFPEDLSKKVGSGPSTPSVGIPPTAAASTASRTSGQSPATTDSELSSSDWARHSESDFRTTPPSSVPTPFLPLDLTPKNSIFSPFLPNLNPLMGNSALTSLANSVLNSTAAFNPVHMSVIAGRAGAARGNTTCSICLKTFACNSALEIHYRSHTKERPFKCTVCERGFSTKGNMKQHMLTHKIRDMPPTVFDSKIHGQSSSKSENGNSSQGGSTKVSASASNASSKASSSNNEDQGSSSEARSKESSASPAKESHSISNNTNKGITKEGESSLEMELHKNEKKSQSSKAESSSAGLDFTSSQEERSGSSNILNSAFALAGNRPYHLTLKGIAEDDSRHSSSGGSKHMCPVCQKSFSSSSSLHIHMRTHTGDKPFKCNVCQKAFTTKGNLKVHMGTHMWTSGASRRGRRMSLELPLGLQFQPPPGDRLDGRNFFPFVPPNFPGGPLAGKFGEYAMFRPPVPFPLMMAPNSVMNPGGPPPSGNHVNNSSSKDDDDDANDSKDEHDDESTS